MISIFPPELAECVREAASILHRCLLRLGSFPYHNDPHRIMSQDVLRTGMIILLRLNGGRLLKQDDGKASLIYPDRLNAAQRTLLFQSMADMQANTTDTSRNVEDDFHVQKALDLITYGNFRRNPWFPTAVTKGPEYPPAEHFPSSNSTLTNGLIPLKEFRPLLRLMLLTQLHVAGIEPDEFTSCLAQVETVTDCLLAAFRDRNSPDATGVSFAAFDQVLDRSLVCIKLLFCTKRVYANTASKTFSWDCPESWGLCTRSNPCRLRSPHHLLATHRFCSGNCLLLQSRHSHLQRG
jgi:hypothetical protein